MENEEKEETLLFSPLPPTLPPERGPFLLLSPRLLQGTPPLFQPPLHSFKAHVCPLATSCPQSGLSFSTWLLLIQRSFSCVREVKFAEGGRGVRVGKLLRMRRLSSRGFWGEVGGAFAAALPIKDTRRKFPLPLDVFSWETLPSGRSETKTRKKISACDNLYNDLKTLSIIYIIIFQNIF